jgi:acyl-CoA synthetase (AMP-forming)/AMP-acid ligase II
VDGLLVDQLRFMADRYPREVAYRHLDADLEITFEAWERASNALARGLVAQGVHRGDRVAIALPGTMLLEWITAYAAIHKAGAVAVPVNTRLTVPELRAILGHAEPVAVLTSEELRPGIDAAVAGITGVRLVTTDLEGLAADDDAEFQVPVDLDDLADVMYTSGTTGLPKGVAVRHRNIALIPNSEPTWTGERWLHASPLFTFAGIGFIYNPMKMGMTGMYQARFDAGRWLSYVERERPTMAFIVPAMAQLLVNHERWAEADLSSLALLSVGSAPLPPETLFALLERLPDTSVSNSYGMTEAGPAFCVMPKEEAGRRIGSVGLPMPPMEVRIVDPSTGAEVPVGEEGEVLIRLEGRQREYYRDPEATARTWEGGWLHTGDIGRLDADGYLYIAGRLKDVIIRGGNNIHAGDVEAVLYEHPGVLEAAAVGIPHPTLGEDVAAAVVAKPGVTLDPAELTEFCRERLADYKVPRRVLVVDELPRNATGKVVKRELSALFDAGSGPAR